MDEGDKREHNDPPRTPLPTFTTEDNPTGFFSHLRTGHIDVQDAAVAAAVRAVPRPHRVEQRLARGEAGAGLQRRRGDVIRHAHQLVL